MSRPVVTANLVLQLEQASLRRKSGPPPCERRACWQIKSAALSAGQIRLMQQEQGIRRSRGGRFMYALVLESDGSKASAESWISLNGEMSIKIA
jgi:hypothetical protein